MCIRDSPLASAPVLCFVDAFNAAIIIACPRCLRTGHLRRAPLGGMEKVAIGLTATGVLLAVAGTVRLNNDAGGGLAELAPVSYTHLDVYKRQSPPPHEEQQERVGVQRVGHEVAHGCGVLAGVGPVRALSLIHISAAAVWSRSSSPVLSS